MKKQKKNGGGSGRGGGSQGGCEQRFEVFVKMKKKWERGVEGWGLGRGGGLGGQGRCNRVVKFL